jgi:uncharacterized membrane protein
VSLLISGLIVFFAIHLLPWIPALRTVFLDRLGFNIYRLFFSLVAAVGFFLIIVGMIIAPLVHYYIPPAWGRPTALLLMFVSFILLPAAHMPSNIKRFTRHPMLWGVLCWSVAHLLNNGDLASILLFGSFAVYAIVDMISANFRGAKKQSTAFPVTKDLIVVMAGAVVYVAVLFLHPVWFGVAVI